MFEKQKKQLMNYWLENRIVKNRGIITAFRRTAREKFVPAHLKEDAYIDAPLPLMHGQTISQPSTIAIMLEALNLKPKLKVLEVGTGSGYNAALIASLVEPTVVYTVELLPELAEFAKDNLKRAGIKNVMVFCRDGSKGLKDYAPFDRIIVTAGAARMPMKLVEQLKPNGIMVVPVGRFTQEMFRVKKNGKKIKIENLGEFVFVPLKEG